MDHVFADNSLTIGCTPLVRLNRITDGAPAKVLADPRHRLRSKTGPGPSMS